MHRQSCRSYKSLESFKYGLKVFFCSFILLMKLYLRLETKKIEVCYSELNTRRFIKKSYLFFGNIFWIICLMLKKFGTNVNARHKYYTDMWLCFLRRFFLSAKTNWGRTLMVQRKLLPLYLISYDLMRIKS